MSSIKGILEDLITFLRAILTLEGIQESRSAMSLLRRLSKKIASVVLYRSTQTAYLSLVAPR